ncbi:MAG: hypothetical protein QNJ74_22925 [Trichodesmium sp. MO_231.B1]|nr:hypothetical protein [Trichodesmium sp. MO_231.B1]
MPENKLIWLLDIFFTSANIGAIINSVCEAFRQETSFFQSDRHCQW